MIMKLVKNKLINGTTEFDLVTGELTTDIKTYNELKERYLGKEDRRVFKYI